MFKAVKTSMIFNKVLLKFVACTSLILWRIAEFWCMELAPFKMQNAGYNWNRTIRFKQIVCSEETSIIMLYMGLLAINAFVTSSFLLWSDGGKSGQVPAIQYTNIKPVLSYQQSCISLASFLSTSWQVSTKILVLTE